MTIEDFTNQYIADNHNPWGESPSTNQYRERGFEQRSFGLWMVKAFRFFCPWALGTVPTRSSYYDDWQPPQTAALLSNPGGISRSCAIETHWLGKVGSTFFEATEMGVCNTHWESTWPTETCCKLFPSPTPCDPELFFSSSHIWSIKIKNWKFQDSLFTAQYGVSNMFFSANSRKVTVGPVLHWNFISFGEITIFLDSNPLVLSLHVASPRNCGRKQWRSTSENCKEISVWMKGLEELMLGKLDNLDMWIYKWMFDGYRIMVFVPYLMFGGFGWIVLMCGYMNTCVLVRNIGCLINVWSWYSTTS